MPVVAKGVVVGPVWVGIDPGARNTGVVVMRDANILWAQVFENPGPLIPEPAYLLGVTRAIQDHIRLSAYPDARIAVEGVETPKWYMNGERRPLNPEAVIGVAATYGALVATFPQAVIVRPGGNGSKPLGAYPRDLVTAGERRKPGWAARVGNSSNARHLRSAHDIIIRGRFQDKVKI